MAGKCRADSRQVLFDHVNHGEVPATQEMYTVSEAEEALFKYQIFARGDDKKLIGVFLLIQIEGQTQPGLEIDP